MFPEMTSYFFAKLENFRTFFVPFQYLLRSTILKNALHEGLHDFSLFTRFRIKVPKRCSSYHGS